MIVKLYDGATELQEIDLDAIPEDAGRFYVGTRPNRSEDYQGDWAVTAWKRGKLFGTEREYVDGRRPLAAGNQYECNSRPEWGHGGYQARVTARRLLLDATGSPVLSWHLTEAYAQEVVSLLDPDGFTLTQPEVLAWVRKTAPGISR